MKNLLLCLTALTLTTGSAAANMLGQGTQTLRISGLFDPDTEAGSRFNLDVGFGYFVADYVEIGLAVSIFSDDFVDAYALGGYGEFNFDTATAFVPFVGLSLRFINSDFSYGELKESSSAGVLGLYGGSKYFITESLALTATLGVDVATDDVFTEEDDITNTDFRFDLGLRFYF